MKKMPVSLILLICEVVLGIFLLVNPVGLSGAILILLGIAAILVGALNVLQYIRLPQEQAAGTWKLSLGAGALAVGISVIANQHWVAGLFGTLSVLYGAVVLIFAFLKLQMALDALRRKRKCWYLAAVSFLLSAITATILFINPFGTEAAAWTFVGIALIVTALLDIVYFATGRGKK